MAEPAKVNGAKVNGAGKEPYQVRRGGQRMRLREAACNDWLCIVDDDVKPEDLTKPNVFALLGKDLQPRDLIRVFPMGNTYYAELVVLDSGLGYADVALIRTNPLPAVEKRSEETLSGFELVQDGVHYNWYAVRKVDRAVLGRNAQIKSKRELIRYVEEHATNRQR